MSVPTVVVTCNAADQGGSQVAFGVYTAKLDQTEIYDGFVVPEVITVTANVEGVALLNLWPNALGVNGSSYRITARNPDTGKKFFDASVVVPNSPCNLYQIIQNAPFPNVDSAQQALIDVQALVSVVNQDVLAADDSRVAAETAAAQALTRSAAAALSEYNASLSEIEVQADKIAVQAIASEFSDLDAAISETQASAEASETSRLAAGVLAGLAAEAKTDAETFAAQAAAATRARSSIAVALADTTIAVGQSFTAPLADGSLQAYTKDSGAAASAIGKSFPTAAAVQALSALIYEGTSSPTYAYQVLDAGGGVVLGVKEDGTLEVPTVLASALETAESSMNVATPNGFAMTFSDSNGLSSVGIKDDGTLAANTAEIVMLNGVSVASIIAGTGSPATQILLLLGRFSAEINGFAAYGQSRSVGEDAQPAISTFSRFDNLRFNGGVRADDAGGSAAANRASLVALTEIDTGTLGETPIAGAVDFVKELILTENGITFAQQAYQFLASAPGQGATTIANLSIGTASFIRLQNDIAYGLSLAQAAGKTYKFRAFTWSQGEADYLANTPAATYEAALIKLRSDIDAYAKSITGQTEDVICIMDQLIDHAARGYANNPYLAIVQAKVAAEQPHFYLATTLGHIDSSGVHHSAAQSKWLGAYFGLVYKRVEIDKAGWKPVKPLTMYRQGKVAMVTFNVPVGALVFDTVNVAQQANYGFTLVDSAGAALTISSVTLVQKDTVKVVAAADIPTGAKLRYGWLTTSLGNLRDSQGGTLTFDGGGLSLPMHNFCTIFEKAFV